MLKKWLMLGFIGLLAMGSLFFAIHEDNPHAWVPMQSLDPSGLDVIPGTNLLIVLSDRGGVTAQSGKFWLHLLAVGDVLKPVPLQLTVSDAALMGDYKLGSKWDGEAIRCRQLIDQAIGCVGVSGSRDHIFWIEAVNTEAAKQGQFTLFRSFRLSHMIAPVFPHKPNNPYEIEALAFLQTTADQVRVLLLSRGPIERFDGSGHYAQYELTFQRQAPVPVFPEAKNTGYNIRKTGRLEAAVCPVGKRFAYEFDHYMRLTELYRQANSQVGFIICSSEKAGQSVNLIPVRFLSDRIEVDETQATVVIGRQHVQHIPPYSLKIEGFSCLNHQPWVAIDSDGWFGGVFALKATQNKLCEHNG